MLYKLLKFQKIEDPSGNMSIIEANNNIPFLVKRLFYIYETSTNIMRGKHANRNSEFILICLSGSVTIRITNGKDCEEIVLNDPNEGIYIPKMIWKDMYNFSLGSILLVLSDSFYDKDEYIRDYACYCNLMNGANYE